MRNTRNPFLRRARQATLSPVATEPGRPRSLARVGQSPPHAAARPGKARSAPGHTLVEIFVSSTLLVIALSLVVVPFVMAKNGMTLGNQRVGQQQNVRGPIEKMVRELEESYLLDIGGEEPSGSGSNTVTVYDSPDKHGLRIKYRLEAQLAADGSQKIQQYKDAASGSTMSLKLFRLLRQVDKYDGLGSYTAQAGSPFKMSEDITWLWFQGQNLKEVSPGTYAWQAATSITKGGLVMLQTRLVQEKAVRRSSDVPEVVDLVQMPMTTSFVMRN